MLREMERFAADRLTNIKLDVEEGFAAPGLNGCPTKHARVTVVFRWRREERKKNENEKENVFRFRRRRRFDRAFPGRPGLLFRSVPTRFERNAQSAFFSATAGSVYAHVFYFHTL